MHRCLKKTLLLICFFVLAGQSPYSSFDIERLPGKSAPEFALKEVNGNYISLTSLRGKVVVLNFWATWCPPCKDEMPSLDMLYKRYKDRGVRVLAVTADSSESKIVNFLKKTPVSYSILLDKDTEVIKLYRVYSIEKYIGEENWLSPGITDTIERLLQ
jgi:peroxiredoxin